MNKSFPFCKMCKVNKVKKVSNTYCSVKCKNLSVVKHGHTPYGKVSPTYRSWSSMKDRCNNPKHPEFKFWGGKGIKYQKLWENFEEFLKDMGVRPEGTSLDRIDGNKGYYKENCRWATSKVQNNNRSTNNRITLNGVTKTLQQWSEETGIKHSTIANRLKSGWSVEEAFMTKILTSRRYPVRTSPAKELFNIKIK